MILARPLAAREIVFGSTILAIFMVSVEATIVATAIPTIVGDLGGLRLFSWVFGVYFLTQAVTIPIYGRLADLFGRRRLLVIAVSVFLAGSILCGFAHTMLALIVFRGLQGLGAGGVQPIASTIVGDLYPGAERPRAQAWLSTTWGVSAVAGPVVGAFLVQHVGWPAIFWINVPFGIVCIAIVVKFFDERLHVKQHRIDYLGSVLLAIGIGIMMDVLVTLGTLPASLVVVLSLVAAVALALLVWHELRTPEPMLPLRLLRLPAIGVATSGNFAIGAMAMGITGFLPTYVQGALGGSAIEAGAALGANIVMWTVGAIVGVRVMVRTSYRATAFAGALCLLAGAAMLAVMTSARGVAWPFVAAGFLGAGFGLANSVYLIATQSAVAWDLRGAVTAANLFYRQVGQAVGTAAFGALFNAGIDATIPDAGTTVAALMNPATRVRLASDVVAHGSQAIGAALHGVYVILVALAAVVAVLCLGIPRGHRPGADAA